MPIAKRDRTTHAQALQLRFLPEGACNRTVFELWLETSLLPTLEPGQVLVQGDRIFQVIQVQAVNCCTYPLIPQTSTCIEHCWSWLKSRIRKQLDRFNCLRSGDRRCIALFVQRHLDGGYTIEGPCNRTIF